MLVNLNLIYGLLIQAPIAGLNAGYQVFILQNLAEGIIWNLNK